MQIGLWLLDPASVLLTDARSMSSVGAIVIALATVIDPFVQQLTAYPQRPYITGSQATLPVRWLGPAPGMQVPVYDAVYQSKSVELSHTCAAGDCSWDGYQSLAVCSQCTNITDLVRFSGNCSGNHTETCGWRLPNGLTIDYDQMLAAGLTKMNTTCSGESLVLRNLGYVIANFSRLDAINHQSCTLNRSRNDVTSVTPLECTENLVQVHATECALFWCINKYIATVKDSALVETGISSWWNQSDHSAVNIPFSGGSYYQMSPTAADWPENEYGLNPLTGSIDEVGDQTDPVSLNNNVTGIQSFYVEQSSHEAFSGWLRSLITSSNNHSNEESSFNQDFDLANIVMAAGPYKNEDGVDRTPQSFSNISQSITQYMRQKTGKFTTEISYNDRLGVAFAVGITIGSRTIVHVRWGWIIYPAALVGLTILFTIVTISSTARRDIPTWKSSTLALMLRGPFSRITSSNEAANVLDLEKRAANTMASLRKDNGGWRIVKGADWNHSAMENSPINARKPKTKNSQR